MLTLPFTNKSAINWYGSICNEPGAKSTSSSFIPTIVAGSGEKKSI